MQGTVERLDHGPPTNIYLFIEIKDLIIKKAGVFFMTCVLEFSHEERRTQVLPYYRRTRLFNITNSTLHAPTKGRAIFLFKVPFDFVEATRTECLTNKLKFELCQIEPNNDYPTKRATFECDITMDHLNRPETTLERPIDCDLSNGSEAFGAFLTELIYSRRRAVIKKQFLGQKVALPDPLPFSLRKLAPSNCLYERLADQSYGPIMYTGFVGDVYYEPTRDWHEILASPLGCDLTLRCYGLFNQKSASLRPFLSFKTTEDFKSQRPSIATSPSMPTNVESFLWADPLTLHLQSDSKSTPSGVVVSLIDKIKRRYLYKLVLPLRYLIPGEQYNFGIIYDDANQSCILLSVTIGYHAPFWNRIFDSYVHVHKLQICISKIRAIKRTNKGLGGNCFAAVRVVPNAAEYFEDLNYDRPKVPFLKNGTTLQHDTLIPDNCKLTPMVESNASLPVWNSLLELIQNADTIYTINGISPSLVIEIYVYTPNRLVLWGFAEYSLSQLLEQQYPTHKPTEYRLRVHQLRGTMLSLDDSGCNHDACMVHHEHELKISLCHVSRGTGEFESVASESTERFPMQKSKSLRVELQRSTDMLGSSLSLSATTPPSSARIQSPQFWGTPRYEGQTSPWGSNDRAPGFADTMFVKLHTYVRRIETLLQSGFDSYQSRQSAEYTRPSESNPVQLLGLLEVIHSQINNLEQKKRALVSDLSLRSLFPEILEEVKRLLRKSLHSIAKLHELEFKNAELAKENVLLKQALAALQLEDECSQKLQSELTSRATLRTQEQSWVSQLRLEMDETIHNLFDLSLCHNETELTRLQDELAQLRDQSACDNQTWMRLFLNWLQNGGPSMPTMPSPYGYPPQPSVVTTNLSPVIPSLAPPSVVVTTSLTPPGTPNLLDVVSPLGTPSPEKGL